MKSDRLNLLADFLQGRGKYRYKGLNKKKFYMGTWQQSARLLSQSVVYDTPFTAKIPKQTKEYIKTVKAGLSFKVKSVDNVVPIKCMTVGCAVGWAATLPEFRRMGLRLQATHLGEFATPQYKGDTGFQAAAKFFGLSTCQVEYLFDPTNYATKKVKDIDYVANRIRAIAEGGSVPKKYRGGHERVLAV